MQRRLLGCLLVGLGIAFVVSGLPLAILPLTDAWRGAEWTRWAATVTGLGAVGVGAFILLKANRLSRDGDGDGGTECSAATEGEAGPVDFLRRADSELAARIPGTQEADVDLDLSWILLLCSTPLLLFTIVFTTVRGFGWGESPLGPPRIAAMGLAGSVCLLWGWTLRLGATRRAAYEVARTVGVGRVARVLGRASPGELEEAQRALRALPGPERDAKIAALVAGGFGPALVALGVVCPRCGRAGATAFAEFRETTALIVVRESRVAAGWHCAPCAGEAFWTMTLRTALLGPLGHHSVLLAMAIVPSNIGWFVTTRRLEPPREGRARWTLPGPAVDALVPHTEALVSHLRSPTLVGLPLHSGPWRRSATPLETALFVIALADLVRSDD